MRQQDFVEQNQTLWARFDAIATTLEGLRGRPDTAQAQAFPGLYRRICNHYALARHRRYATALVDTLHDRVLRGHSLLYRRKPFWLWPLLRFVAIDFPTTLRRHGRAFWLAAALFWLPGLVMGVSCYLDPDLVYTVLDAPQVNQFDHMYDPQGPVVGRSEERAADSDFVMFGFYVWNNVGIGFRTFALGMLAGLGSAYLLLYNGLNIGAVSGYVSKMGYGTAFWPFVAGHSALELTAITISGCAGLLLAGALLFPGRRRRGDALKRAAREAVKLMIGAMLMLFGAAFMEAFWSAHRLLPPLGMYLVAALLWGAVLLYLLRAGRGRGT